ncbi:ABC transporter permease [Secundilactobacillus kimchicus]|uniref:ABC superfamily ATP binding cassette transporter, membrane protein n=1 Tax=Secundilactobacillus kimchicus JCM 15530 TaxID=1302272 RepID=A0A0R1HWF2_9LACO|nr:ABC transporter permease [Secundilactobacillus kimchicus]KRK47111.1 ABC superfamily ATP binding cassette transporter, membrane protein [Secundilactobacillus kimchicus JCM 15530]MBT9672521.1 ABC transporter permease subunit [Secundilactobacillus kimchicus]
MLTLVRQELFKLIKKRSTWITTIIMLVTQIGLAIWAKTTPKVLDPRAVFDQQFFGVVWYLFFLIAAAASIITMEFQYGTIKEVLYRKYYRGEIMVSKWLTLFIYSLYWVVLSWVVSMLLRAVLFADKIDLGAKVANGNTVLMDSIQQTAASFLTLWLLLSLVLLLANLFKNSAVAVSVGIVGYFVTQTLASILTMLIHKWAWLKWNPLTMLFYPSQLSSYDMYHAMTKLTNVQMFCGNVVYIAIFLGLGYWIFKKRSV